MWYWKGKKKPTVSWSRYQPELKTRIESYISTKNCKELQIELDIAFNQNEGRIRKDEIGNSNLISYLDYHLEKSGCY